MDEGGDGGFGGWDRLHSVCGWNEPRVRSFEPRVAEERAVEVIDLYYFKYSLC